MMGLGHGSSFVSASSGSVGSATAIQEPSTPDIPLDEALYVATQGTAPSRTARTDRPSVHETFPYVSVFLLCSYGPYGTGLF